MSVMTASIRHFPAWYPCFHILLRRGKSTYPLIRSCYSTRSQSRFSLQEDLFQINSQQYTKDEWTNLTPYIVTLIKRDLLHQPQQPINLVAEATKTFFHDFRAFDYDDPVVTLNDNFDSLLIPKDHVSRSKKDSYYVNKDYLLRTHTSAHQTHCLAQGSTKFICIADVFRRDSIDSTHYPVFHQCEAFNTYGPEDLYLTTLYKDAPSPRNENSQERYSEEATEAAEKLLKQTIENYVKFLLDDSVQFKWVSAYFPFTHPSWELEIFYNNKWIEVVGAGIVEEKILLNSGVDGKISWALGFGMERMAMIRYNIPDVRLFWTKDIAYQVQFRDLKPLDKFEFKPISKFPARIHDISFWIPEGLDWSENDFYDLCRSLGEESIELVEIIDDYTNPKGRRSQCFRVVYRSWERCLRKEEAMAVHKKIEEEVVRRFNVEIR